MPPPPRVGRGSPRFWRQYNTPLWPDEMESGAKSVQGRLVFAMADTGKHGDLKQPMLSAAAVRAVANLARLELSDDQIDDYRAPMAAVLGYMNRLQTLDLAGIEPMSHPNDTVNRLDADETKPDGLLPTEALMRMAPDKHEPFVRVPGVFASE